MEQAPNPSCNNNPPTMDKRQVRGQDKRHTGGSMEKLRNMKRYTLTYDPLFGIATIKDETTGEKLVDEAWMKKEEAENIIHLLNESEQYKAKAKAWEKSWTQYCLKKTKKGDYYEWDNHKSGVWIQSQAHPP